MSKIFEHFGTQFLPAFPPKDFYEKISPEDFTIKMIKSELAELSKIRETLKPHIKEIPRTHLLPHERVQYFINKANSK